MRRARWVWRPAKSQPLRPPTGARRGPRGAGTPVPRQRGLPALTLPHPICTVLPAAGASVLSPLHRAHPSAAARERHATSTPGLRADARQRGPRGLTRLAGSVAAAAQASLPGTATGSSAPCPSRPSSWPGSVLAGTAQRGRASPTHRPLPRPPPRPRPARRRALGAVTSSRSAACHAARLEGGRRLGATVVTCGTGVPASVSRGPSPRLSGWLHYRPS